MTYSRAAFLTIFVLVSSSDLSFAAESNVGSSAGLIEESYMEGRVENSQRYVFQMGAGNNGVYWRVCIISPSRSSFVSIHFADFNNTSSTPWTIDFLSSTDTPLLQLRPKNIAAQETPKHSFWTGHLPADVITVVVKAPAAPAGLSFTIDKVVYESIQPETESIVDPRKPEMEKYLPYRSDPVYSIGESVARIHIVTEVSEAWCTGFLMKGNRLVTNDHCFPQNVLLCSQSGKPCDDAYVTFGLDSGNARGQTYQCSSMIRSYPLDLAVLNLTGNPNADWTSVNFSSTPVYRHESLFVVEHPKGGVKTIAIQRCHAERVGVPGRRAETQGTKYSVNQDFEHTCDTDQGSSGSPIFDTQGGVVGLHHAGFDSSLEDPALRVNRAVLGNLVEDFVAH